MGGKKKQSFYDFSALFAGMSKKVEIKLAEETKTTFIYSFIHSFCLVRVTVVQMKLLACTCFGEIEQITFIRKYRRQVPKKAFVYKFVGREINI